MDELYTVFHASAITQDLLDIIKCTRHAYAQNRYFSMNKRIAIYTSLFCMGFALPGYAENCEIDARAAMLDVAHPVPMRQDVSTKMAGQTFDSSAISTPDRYGMAFDVTGKPVSLWRDGEFYTTADSGESWTLLSRQSAEERAAQDSNLKKQADQASEIECDYGASVDGKDVHRFSLSYTLIPAGTPVRSTYWVDRANMFPWKVVHEFGGANPSVITQMNTPAPGLTVPDPNK